LALGKPTLVTRWKTERPEVLKWNTVRLIGPNSIAIIEEGMRLYSDRDYYDSCAQAHFPFGRGDSAQLIVKILAAAASRTSIEVKLLWIPFVPVGAKAWEGSRHYHLLRRLSTKARDSSDCVGPVWPVEPCGGGSVGGGDRRSSASANVDA